MTKRILLEVCTDSVDGCVTAQQGGADRIELNAALFLGGLTPSLGLLQEARQRVTLPIVAMVRPRPGGFCYNEAEFAVMQRDVELLLAEGVQGIVFGVLTPDGEIDVARCRQLIKLLQTHDSRVETIFHRAFDLTPNPIQALDQLVALGITRLLTSGQSANSLAGAKNIAHYREHVKDRLQILPGAGITRNTVADLLTRTGCAQVHGSFSGAGIDPSAALRPELGFGLPGRPASEYFTPELAHVAAVRRILDGDAE